MTKQKIFENLIAMRAENEKNSAICERAVSVEDYSHLVIKGSDGDIWTDAFQTAINENSHIFIPSSQSPYIIDKTLLVPSNRFIEAEKGAVIRQAKGVTTLLVRNANNENGTKTPESFKAPDRNIRISGGRWEESRDSRAGYGQSGKYDENRSFYGVSACMFFNNICGLTLENMTFSHAGGFSIQLGNLKNVCVENITFDSCFADGVHVNGNIENILIRNISGCVGDDLVAFNMYDWQDSSVDFGPIKCAWCENVASSENSIYKSFRILPGIYYYEDGKSVDCSLSDAVFKGIRGVKTVKLYFQTPAYDITAEREPGDCGSADNIYFEDISLDLDEPCDKFPVYTSSDPVLGSIAGFEIGANIKDIYFENIKMTLHREKYPMSFFACAGPKSCRIENLEIFDPEISCTVKNIHLKDVFVNGETENLSEYIHEIDFADYYGDGKAVGKGIIENITL